MGSDAELAKNELTRRAGRLRSNTLPASDVGAVDAEANDDADSVDVVRRMYRPDDDADAVEAIDGALTSLGAVGCSTATGATPSSIIGRSQPYASASSAMALASTCCLGESMCSAGCGVKVSDGVAASLNGEPAELGDQNDACESCGGVSTIGHETAQTHRRRREGELDLGGHGLAATVAAEDVLDLLVARHLGLRVEALERDDGQRAHTVDRPTELGGGDDRLWQAEADGRRGDGGAWTSEHGDGLSFDAIIKAVMNERVRSPPRCPWTSGRARVGAPARHRSNRGSSRLAVTRHERCQSAPCYTEHEQAVSVVDRRAKSRWRASATRVGAAPPSAGMHQRGSESIVRGERQRKYPNK